MKRSAVGVGPACLRLRKHTRWSQSELAFKMKVSQQSVSNWEASAPDEILRIHPMAVQRLKVLLKQARVRMPVTIT